MNTQTNSTGNGNGNDADFGAEAKHHMRETRLDRILSGAPLSTRKVRGRKSVKAQAAATTVDTTPDTTPDTFQAETGWTWADAVDMAAECRRDDRLFGRRNLFA